MARIPGMSRRTLRAGRATTLEECANLSQRIAVATNRGKHEQQVAEIVVYRNTEADNGNKRNEEPQYKDP
jgi:hypothetical protein